MERLSQHATLVQDGVEDFDLVFSKSFFKLKYKAFRHILWVYGGGLKEAKKPEVGMGFLKKIATSHLFEK